MRDVAKVFGDFERVQLTGGKEQVPYRESKVTHLFKNYFDGEGHSERLVRESAGQRLRRDSAR